MSILDRLDNFYNSKKANEVWLMVALASVLIGYLVYTLLSPMAESYKNEQERIHNDLTNKINSANSFLQKITVNGDRDYMIKDLNKKIVQKNMELNNYRAKLQKIDGAMQQLSNVLYTKDNWSKFLHNIAVKAKENDLKLSNITNIVLDRNASFGKVLDVSIRTKGKYGNILAFMNDLEKTKLVSNITNVKFKATESSPVVDINLSVWGIRP